MGVYLKRCGLTEIERENIVILNCLLSFTPILCLDNLLLVKV